MMAVSSLYLMSKFRQIKQRGSFWTIIGSASGASRSLRGLEVSTEDTDNCAVLCVFWLDALEGLVMVPFGELCGSDIAELIA